MTTIYGTWNGGGSYGPSDPVTDLERFESVEDALDAMDNRRDNGYVTPQRFEFVNRTPESTLTPCVDESSSIHLYLAVEEADGELVAPDYPDFVVEFDPADASPRVTPA